MAFIDRVVEFPGRVQLTNVSGDVYDMVRAEGDEYTEGTLLNATNLNQQTQLDNAVESIYTTAGMTSGTYQNEVSDALGFLMNFLKMFGKELTMSKSSWTSSTCTVTDISKYNLIMAVVGGDQLVAVRNGNSFRGGIITGNGPQYISDLYFTTSGDTCTYGYACQIPHNASGNHGAVTTGRAITKIVGLIPIM